jgi:hypothetical protein
MEENANFPTTRSVGVRYGLFLGIFSIAYFLVLSMLNVDMSSGLGKWASTPVAAFVIFLAHKYFKDNGDGFMSYGQGVGIGFWAGLVSSALSATFTFIYVKFIDASFVEAILRKAEEDMQAKGQSQAQIEQAMPYVEMFTSPAALFGFGLVFGIIGSVIIALIVSIFTQKQPPRQTV